VRAAGAFWCRGIICCIQHMFAAPHGDCVHVITCSTCCTSIVHPHVYMHRPLLNHKPQCDWVCVLLVKCPALLTLVVPAGAAAVPGVVAAVVTMRHFVRVSHAALSVCSVAGLEYAHMVCHRYLACAACATHASALQTVQWPGSAG
jgi:hypothetical protein